MSDRAGSSLMGTQASQDRLPRDKLTSGVGSLGDLGLIPGLGGSPGEGISYPLQFSVLGKSMDRGAWQTAVHGIPKSRT